MEKKRELINPSSQLDKNEENLAVKTTGGEKVAASASDSEESKFLIDLSILPPLQKGEKYPTAFANGQDETKEKDGKNAVKGLIHLPPIRAEEPVASLRAALSEVKGYAHITHYRLVLDPANLNAAIHTPLSSNDVDSTSDTKAKNPNEGKKKKKNKNNQKSAKGNVSSANAVAVEDVASPFTGINAMIMAPHGIKNFSLTTYPNAAPASTTALNECVLDDYGDLTPLLLENNLQNGSSFRMILTRYDAAGIRDHIARLRVLLDGNAPFVLTLDENRNDSEVNDTIEQEDQEAKSSDAEKEAKQTVSDSDENAKDDANQLQNVKEQQKDTLRPDDEQQKKLRDQARASHLKEIAEKMPSFPLQNHIAIDGSNIKDYYYLACGEEEALYDLNEKKEGKANEAAEDRLLGAKLEKLDEQTRVNCMIRYSGFNPPPSHRRLLGDLAYLEISTPGSNEGTVHVTATPLGFYVNRTSPHNAVDNGNGLKSPYIFNPAPASNSCFSHELLDCILQRSKSFRSAWAKALTAAKDRAQLISMTTAKDSPIKALHRVAIRSSLNSTSHQNIDSVIFRPPWIVQQHEEGFDEKHDYNINRAEDDLASTYGLDIRGGSLRDWNEELQSAREMPKTTLQERIERARMVHKVLTDFGEAALTGALAIIDGHVSPMNPNEDTRSHVYLHNNIFFSRAVDAGPDTFKVSQGDRAARKSASRDAQCMGALHRLDISNLHTLATVLIDYLGTRLVCQSIVPGILHGEKTHTLLYGAVEAVSPLTWNEEMHESLERAIGKGLMVGSRKVPTWPLSEERMTKLLAVKVEENPLLNEKSCDEVKDKNETISMCGPLEAKGIKGSDQRNYILDLTRLTPRDANWVSKEEGGTGNWEDVWLQGTKKAQKQVPKSIKDDEWTMAVLRPELITHLTHKEMSDYIKKKTIKENIKKELSTKESGSDSVEGEQDKVTSRKTASEIEKDEDKIDESAEVDQIPKTSSDMTEVLDVSTDQIKVEDEEYLNSLRYNLNVFLPGTKSLAEIDPDSHEIHMKDEDRARAAANHLWNNVLSSITKEMRENSSISAHQIPVDGVSLTETLHSRGINCRYLGRLAQLAEKEEQKDRESEADVVSGKASLLPRKSMPLCWLELLECEMVARAAKHVLDRYLTEVGGAASTMPAETIANFLSALLSTREESAGETELRINKQNGNAEVTVTDEELSSMTLSYDGGGDSLPRQTRSRTEVWNDIEEEVGRRFRYSLSLYNTKGNGKDDKLSSRAMFVPLLRRICQRAGLRISAKTYDLGRTCLCSSASVPGRISASYPISPIDIVDIIPMVKHAAAHGGEGFVPCSQGGLVGSPSLYILLPDAKATFEAAHAHWSARLLPKALDLTQEAAAMYQQVTDTPLHANVSRCLDLTAVILFQAQEPELAAANAARALAIAVQLGGFDCAEAVTAHTTLGHILISSGGLAGGVKHLRAALYLMELMGGSHYAELANMYHKLGTMYHEIGNGINALRFYKEAARRQVSDRMVEGMISKSSALVLAALGQFKSALESERKAYGIYKLILGNEHEMTVTSANSLKHLMKLAVEQGTRLVAEEKKRLESEAADAIASKIEADEAEEEKKKKKKKKKSKKKS